MTLFRPMGSIQYGNDTNNERFLSYINQIPRVVNNKTNTLAFGVWEFDITRIIHPTATIDEIFDAGILLLEKEYLWIYFFYL